MNEEEIAEAIKIIREPIVVNSDIYHTFDQENYNKLQQVYDNCQWFINNQEQIMQNAVDNKKKADQLTNNWNELEEWIMENVKDEKPDLYFQVLRKIDILDKMKEIKEGNNVSSRD